MAQQNFVDSSKVSVPVMIGQQRYAQLLNEYVCHIKIG